MSADSPMHLSTFADYVHGHPITSMVKEIAGFEFAVQYQDNGALRVPGVLDTVVAEGLAAINQVLLDSGIHYQQHLKANVEGADPANPHLAPPGCQFTLDHDVSHFGIAVTGERFSIIRGPSSFRDFYDWYTAIMPHAARIERTLRRAIEKSAERRWDPVQTNHQFELNFCDFQSRSISPQHNRTRNVEVLSTLIPFLPEGTSLQPLSEQLFYRLDLTLSRLEEFGETQTKRRNAWYYLEAPFNEDGRFLVFRAQLRNTAIELLQKGAPDRAPTLPFDGNFSDDYRLALEDFLRDRALEGFAARLLGNWDFNTQRRVQ